jgi:hypothetical protein
MAEFEGPNEVVEAARRVHEAGYKKVDAYSPYPIEELAEILGFTKTRVPLIVFIGGVVGGVGGFLMQYYACVISYPLNVGGRPFDSWPAFIPVTFELTILCAGLFAVLGMLALNGLPMPYHPVFNVPRFALASRDRFFLCIEASDKNFERDETWRFLDRMTPRSVSEVEF